MADNMAKKPKWTTLSKAKDPQVEAIVRELMSAVPDWADRQVIRIGRFDDALTWCQLEEFIELVRGVDSVVRERRLLVQAALREKRLELKWPEERRPEVLEAQRRLFGALPLNEGWGGMPFKQEVAHLFNGDVLGGRFFAVSLDAVMLYGCPAESEEWRFVIPFDLLGEMT